MSGESFGLDWSTPYLREGETIIWSGRPQSGHLPEAKRQKEGFAVLFVFLLLSQVIAFTGFAPIIFQAVVLAALLFSLGCLVWVFVVTPTSLKNSGFAITDRRVLIRIPGLREEIYLFALETISQASVRSHPKGTGDILFLSGGHLPHRAIYSTKYGTIVHALPASLIFNIEQPDTVSRILTEASERAKSN